MTTTILVAADAKWVRDQVRAAFVGPSQTVIEVSRGQDVRDTFADVEELMRDTGYSPSTPIEVGVARFVAWYREFYGV